MLRRTCLASMVGAGMALAAPPTLFARRQAGTALPAAGDDLTAPDFQSAYAPVNGLEMYYEIHGSGEPLVLLHGAFSAIDLWGPILETLAQDRQVIAVEFQGHGHTADIDRPFSYEQFADDVAAVMDHLDIPQADVMGYSMGGNTAWQVAMRHPARVRKLVAISANYRTDAYDPELLALIQTLTPEMFAGSPPEEAYARTAPNPDDWPVLFEKMKAFEATVFAWSEAALRAIEAPSLLIAADAEGFPPEHTVSLFGLLGGGVPVELPGPPRSRLAIIPGADHVSLVVEHSSLWLPMVEMFLDAPR